MDNLLPPTWLDLEPINAQKPNRGMVPICEERTTYLYRKGVASDWFLKRWPLNLSALFHDLFEAKRAYEEKPREVSYKEHAKEGNKVWVRVRPSSLYWRCFEAWRAIHSAHLWLDYNHFRIDRPSREVWPDDSITVVPTPDDPAGVPGSEEWIRVVKDYEETELKRFERALKEMVDYVGALAVKEAVIHGAKGSNDGKKADVDPPVKRLTADVAKRTVTLDGTCHEIESVLAVRWVKVLSDHATEWITANGLVQYDNTLNGARTDLLRKYLPECVASLIESKPGAGSRLKI